MTWHTIEVPGRDFAVGANIAAINAQFPNGVPIDGAKGQIRQGAWPDTEYVRLTYDATAPGRWVSRADILIAMGDQAYMGVNSGGYTYIATDNAGGANGSFGWTTRSIRKVSAFLAAGLKLQAKLSAVMFGTVAPATFTVMPFFFNHDDLETVVGSNDGASAAAWLGTPLISPANNVVTKRDIAWQDILKNGTVNALAAADVPKANLWPRLYGKVSAGAAYGSIIDVDLQYRWVSA